MESEQELLKKCDDFAAMRRGAWPKVIMLGQGENDRFDHVRRAEHQLAKAANAAAIRLGVVVTASWRARSPCDWLQLGRAATASAGVAVHESTPGGEAEVMVELT